MFLLVPAHPGRPGQRAVKQLCVCTILSLFTAVGIVAGDVNSLLEKFEGNFLNSVFYCACMHLLVF